MSTYKLSILKNKDIYPITQIYQLTKTMKILDIGQI